MNVATEPITTMRPGLYPGLSYEEYQGLDAVNHSLLEPFRRTPAHAREAILHPKEPSDAMALGQAFHVLVLEPAKFVARYVVPPKVDRRFKEGKATWAAFEASNPGKLLLAADEMEACERMRDSVMSHPMASEFLGHAVAREITFLWDELVDGEPVLCKGREDLIAPNGGWAWIINLKTTKNAAERPFQSDVYKFGYHRASAWYRRGLATLKPAERRVAYIAVETEPPYCVAVHELDTRALEQGEREMLGFLTQYVTCKKTNEWPGYDPGLSLIDLPAYGVDRLD